MLEISIWVVLKMQLSARIKQVMEKNERSEKQQCKDGDGDTGCQTQGTL
jgi:hypothetical protein